MDEARLKASLQQASEVAWQQGEDRIRGGIRALFRIWRRVEAKSRPEAGRTSYHEEGTRRGCVVLMGCSLGPGVEISKLNRKSRSTVSTSKGLSAGLA